MTLKNQILYTCFFVFPGTCLGQSTEKYKTFKSSDYPANKYEIKLETAEFSKFKIEILQVKRLNGQPTSPFDFYCRGWLTIKQGSKIISKRYFKSIEPVGSCYGLFIPAKQRLKDHFIISKFGDYDGCIFIIDTTGHITEKMGGEFYVSADEHYLFSSYDSDLSGLTVYDLDKKLILFSDTIEPYLGDWYYKDEKYFAETWNPGEDGIDSSRIAIFDLIKNKIIISTGGKDYLKAGVKLKLFNDVNKEKECNCGR